MKLRQPRALRTTLEGLLREPRGEEELRKALVEMEGDELMHCLHCARDWNTTAQHSLIAHRLLNALLQVVSLHGRRRSSPVARVHAQRECEGLRAWWGVAVLRPPPRRGHSLAPVGVSGPVSL